MCILMETNDLDRLSSHQLRFRQGKECRDRCREQFRHDRFDESLHQRPSYWRPILYDNHLWPQYLPKEKDRPVFRRSLMI